jgi:hypothetical protein
MWDAYERDMIRALISGEGPEVGADRQVLRRAVTEPLAVCRDHQDRLKLEEAVLVEISGDTGRVWHLLLCAEAFETSHRQQALEAAIASPVLAATVYDGRQLFGAGTPAPQTDPKPEQS